MVSTNSLVLLIGAIAPAAMAAPAPAADTGRRDSPPAVYGPSGPAGPENVPNTVPTNANLPSKYTGTLVQFWKAPHFRGDYVSTSFDKSNVCYGFSGKGWAEWSMAIESINIVSGGPCCLYDGRECNRPSIGPFKRGSPIPDLAVANG